MNYRDSLKCISLWSLPHGFLFARSHESKWAQDLNWKTADSISGSDGCYFPQQYEVHCSKVPGSVTSHHWQCNSCKSGWHWDYPYNYPHPVERQEWWGEPGSGEYTTCFPVNNASHQTALCTQSDTKTRWFLFSVPVVCSARQMAEMVHPVIRIGLFNADSSTPSHIYLY